MSRPRKSRKLITPPVMKGFKPFGLPFFEVDTLKLNYEEFESIKMVDYDKLSQKQAAEQMNISRPTFTRIYNKALKTIARAFVEAKAIEIEGGDFTFEQDWYRCTRCFKLIEGIENHVKCKGCNSFGTSELVKINN